MERYNIIAFFFRKSSDFPQPTINDHIDLIDCVAVQLSNLSGLNSLKGKIIAESTGVEVLEIRIVDTDAFTDKVLETLYSYLDKVVREYELPVTMVVGCLEPVFPWYSVVAACFTEPFTEDDRTTLASAAEEFLKDFHEQTFINKVADNFLEIGTLEKDTLSPEIIQGLYNYLNKTIEIRGLNAKLLLDPVNEKMK